MKTLKTTLSILLVICLCGCRPKGSVETPPAGPSQIDRLKEHAKNIIANPKNWTQNSQALAEYTTIAAELGISNKEEVTDFRDKATALVVFGTSWVDQLNEGEWKAMSRGTDAIVADLNVMVPQTLIPISAGGEFVREAKQKQVETLVITATNKLSKEQAKEFSGVYVSALAAYSALVVILSDIK